MRRFCSSRGGFALFLAGIVTLCWPVPTPAKSFEFLYIEANEGSASGGHAAIKFGEDIFHFQHVKPGLLRIYRHDFSAFRFGYGYRENRAIEGHRIDVEDAVFEALREAFDRRLLIQNRQFAVLKALLEDLELFRGLQRLATAESSKQKPDGIELKALGYFFNDYGFNPAKERHHVEANEKSPTAALKRAVVEKYGVGFLARKRLEIREQLQNLKPRLQDSEIALSKDRFPGGRSFGKQYQNLLLDLAALDVLESGLSPRPGTLLTGNLPSLQLNAEAKTKLSRFNENLFSNLVSLLRSEREDWGYPLLVGIARMHALQHSVDSGYMTVLDRFRHEDNANDIGVDQDNLRAMIEFAGNALKAAANRLTSGEPLDERRYAELEVRYGTILKIEAVKTDSSFSLPAVDDTPALPAKAALIPLGLTSDELADYERSYLKLSTNYLEQLMALYEYRLLARNCVTELFSVINQTLVTQTTLDPDARNFAAESVEPVSERLLGGYIAGSDLTAVPFAAFDQVGSEYSPIDSYRLPPYREQQIEKSYREDDGVLVDLRESNVLTSTIYHWHEQDAAFLFFTQDAIWPRPLLGSLNLSVALGQAIYGLFALPWDSGQNLQTSLKGIFVSVPELFFFNIRKGSFPKLIPEVSPPTPG